MAKKSPKSKSAEAEKAPIVAPTPVVAPNPLDGIPAWAQAGLPSPDEMAERAAFEDEEISVEDYLSSVYTLREKGWSWRQISTWFRRQGLNFSHVAIFRAYKDDQELRAEQGDGPDDVPEEP